MLKPSVGGRDWHEGFLPAAAVILVGLCFSGAARFAEVAYETPTAAGEFGKVEDCGWRGSGKGKWPLVCLYSSLRDSTLNEGD
jgi:hypothetical protein